MTWLFVAAFATACVVSFLATPLARAAAVRAGLFDVPNARSSHSVSTPRLGGLAIIAGAGISIAILVPIDSQMGYLLAAALAIGAVGAADDIRALSRALRFAAQLGAAILLLTAARLSIPANDFPWLAPAGEAALAVVTVLWIVGLTNAFNFMDGINGLAASEAAIASATLATLASRHDDVAGAAMLLAVCGAAIGFLPWNFPRAFIFMGDAGSAALGLILAAAAVRISQTPVAFIAAVLPLTPFLLDTFVTLLTRIWRREPFLEAHRSHFYQRLVRLGLGHAAVTSIWSALAVCSSVASLFYDSATPAGRAVLVAGVILVHALVAMLIMRMERARQALPPYDRSGL